MPCLNLSTNVGLEGIDTSSILSEATKTVAKIVGKPEAVSSFSSPFIIFFFWVPTIACTFVLISFICLCFPTATLYFGYFDLGKQVWVMGYAYFVDMKCFWIMGFAHSDGRKRFWIIDFAFDDEKCFWVMGFCLFDDRSVLSQIWVFDVKGLVQNQFWVMGFASFIECVSILSFRSVLRLEMFF